MEILKTPVEDLPGSLKAFVEASTYIEATLVHKHFSCIFSN